MRLRTKIILICCVSIFLSSIICNVVVYHLVKKSAVDAAEGQGIRNAYAAFTDIRDRIERVGADRTTDQVMRYIVKYEKDELIVCFGTNRKDGGDIFNSTVFDREDFEGLDFDQVSGDGVGVAGLTWEDRHFLIYGPFFMMDYSIYKLDDITYVWERMGMFGAGLVVLSMVVAVVVTAVIFFMLNKVLQPLQKLNEGAKQIAQGRYDERIVVVRNDEIGELGVNFNKMADAVRSQIIKLKEAQERRTLFMGNLTHELKTPMTAISGYARTLLTAKLSDGDKEEALSYIYSESCRLERLSQKMMNLLMLEGDDGISFATVPADVLFQNAEEACRQNLAEDGIVLEGHGNGHSFHVDADLFTEVLINLIDNARKASEKGDRIILSATGDSIRVRDFGRGIPDDAKEKILEPFYMIDKSRSRKNGGAGLGLAIAALILKRHGCEMRIESKIGEGTLIILQFV